MDSSTIVFLVALVIGTTAIIAILTKSAKRETITCNITTVINNILADLVEDGAIVKNPNRLSPSSVMRGPGKPRNDFAQLVLDTAFYDKPHVKISTLHNNLMRNRSFLANSVEKFSFKGLDPHTPVQQRITLGNDDMKSLLPGMVLNPPYRKSSPSGSGGDISYLGAGAVFSDGYSDGGSDSSGGDGGGGGD